MKISLRAARVNVDLTQQEVADKLGVSKYTIINWERGRTKPKKHILIALSSIYGIDIDSLKG